MTGQMKPGSIVSLSYRPTPGSLVGVSVWRLVMGASTVRVSTVDGAMGARLIADGHVVDPILAIPPPRKLEDDAIDKVFRDDMEHLEAVFQGDTDGACDFYDPAVIADIGADRKPGTDADCARRMGEVNVAEFEQAVAETEVSSWNGWTVVVFDHDEIRGSMILNDRRHFRFITEADADKLG